MNKLLRLIIVLVGLFSMGSAMFAQTTVIIGAGATTTGTSGITPYTTFWEDGRVQYIIQASELSAAGLGAGNTITALGFNVTIANAQPLNGFSIKLGHTANSAHPGGGYLPTSTVCFSQSLGAATVGWNMYAFTTPFIWNGIDNIVVEACFDNAAWNGNSTVQADVYPFFPFYGQYDDGQAGCSMTTGLTSTQSGIRPRMQLTYLSAPCVAPPTPGTVVSSANPVCPNTNFTLSLNGASSGMGQTYQWQSSPSGNVNTWVDIAGAINPSYAGTILTPTYFRCVLTCSSQSDTTPSFFQQVNNFLSCYCTPTTSFGCGIDYISNVTFNQINNNSGCDSPTSYSDYTSTISTTAFLGETYPISVTTDGDTEGITVWIDYDQSGTFDPTEIVLTGYAGTVPATYTANVTIPLTAASGPTRMRVRCNYGSAPVDPCANQSYGEAEDYMIIITPFPNDDAGIAALVSPVQPACTLGSSIEVALTNIGTNTLTSANIHYSINGGTPNTFNWTGSIAPTQSANVVIGSSAFNDMDIIKIWVSNPNGQTDVFPYNDTIEVTLYEALNGVYTVYGTTPDFNTLTDAVNELELRGICGDVTFNLRPGTYNEQVLINDYASLGNYSVTIQSETQNAADVKLEFFPGVSNNYVIGFEESHDVILQHLTLANTSFYAGVVNFLGGNDQITVQNCRIYSDSLATTSTTNKAAVYSFNGVDNNILIRNNEIVGGSYGIWMFGENNPTVESGLKIEGNTIRKYYGAGLVAVYQNRPEVMNNTIFSDNANANTNIFHLDIEVSLNGAVVTGNSINGVQGGFGINLVNVDAQPGNKSLVANNFIYMGSITSPTNNHGIAIQDCSNANVVFNSVHTRAATATAAGVRIYNGQSAGINLINNNIVNSGAGYAVNSESQFYIDQSDYNNFFTSGANFVRVGNNAADLAALQSATGKDANSLSVDPNFNGEDLHTCRVELDNAGTPISGITVDFDGDIRNTQTPDIGADEFTTAENFTLGPDIIKCPADSVLIVAEQIGSASYYWSPYFQTTSSIYATNPGLYIVQIVHGCGYSIDTIVVTNSALPSASFSYTQNFFTGSFNNTSSNATSFHWDFGDGNTSNLANPNHVFPTNGTYTVTLTAYSECGDSAVTSQVVVINPNVAGLDEETVVEFSVYPNPSEGVFAINLSPVQSSEVQVQIMDLSGRMILTRTLGSASAGLTEWMNISGQAAGTYILKVTAGNHISTSRIIIK